MRLGNPEIPRLMGDTLGSVQITASSGPGGAITFRLPGGQTINSPLRLPVVTIPAPDPFPGLVATTTMLRSLGTPTLTYANGRLRVALVLRPDDRIRTITTNWTSSSIFLPDPPDLGVQQIVINASFRLGRQGNQVVAEDFQVVVAAVWQLPGLLNALSSTISPIINRAVSESMADLLRQRVELLVRLSIAPYLLQATGYSSPLQLDSIAHNADHIALAVTGHHQRPPVDLTAFNLALSIDPSALKAGLEQSKTHEAQAKKSAEDTDEKNNKAQAAAKANAKVPLTPAQTKAVEAYKKGADGDGGNNNKKGK